MASRLPAKLPTIADALPPPGTGSADARRSENSVRVSPASESEGAASTPSIVAP
jgi:hypothetical protein